MTVARVHASARSASSRARGLTRPPDQGDVVTPTPTVVGVEHPQQPVGRHRLGLALGHGRGSTASASTASRTRAYVAPPSRISPVAGRLLQARGRVDRVAGGKRASGPGRAGHHRAGVDAGPDRRAGRQVGQQLARTARRRASFSSHAARTARSASSSWTSGMPNTASTASPTNFSTVPAVPLDGRARDREVAAHHLR